MSSKLITKEGEAAVQPIAWHNVRGPQTVGVRPASVGAAVDEQAHLFMEQQARIQQLERQMEERVRQAHQQGQAAGEASGAKQAAQRLEPVIARLSRTIDELANLRRRVRQEAEEDAVRLAVAVAKRVLNRELTVDPESLLGIVKAAFQKIDARETHRVRMHPEDLPLVQNQAQQLGFPPNLELYPDPSLERGAVIFETTRGNMDASVAVQLREIERGFVDLVRRNST